MATHFQIKRGLRERLLDENNKPLITIEEGVWYLTSDSNEVFIGHKGNNDDVELNPLISGGVQTYNSTLDLPTIGHKNIVYIIVTKNKISHYRWAGTHYELLEDAGSFSVRYIYGGDSSEELGYAFVDKIED